MLVTFLVWDPYAKEDGFRNEEEKRRNISLGPNTPSQISIEPVSDQSSSKKNDNSEAAGILAILLILHLMVSSWALVTTEEGLRKEEEKRKTTLPRETGPCREFSPRTQGKELAEKMEALDKEHMEHCRQCEIVVEVKMETEEALIEKDKSLKSAREAVNARVSQGGSNHSPIVLVMLLSVGLGVLISVCGN